MRRGKRRRRRYIDRRRQLRLRIGAAALVIFGIATAVICGWGRKNATDAGDGKVYARAVAQSERIPSAIRETEQEKEKTSPVVVLDAGHGGKDSGTLWEGIYEKDINLDIIKKVRQMLEEDGYTVVMVRDSDIFVELEDRIGLAEREDADLFVSVHQNAVENDTVSHGLETYCNGAANADSPRLASAVHRHLIGETGAKDRGVRDESEYYVVKNTTMPSCLVETGFLTEPEERRLLQDEEYQKKLARGIADGIREYLEEKEAL